MADKTFDVCAFLFNPFILNQRNAEAFYQSFDAARWPSIGCEYDRVFSLELDLYKDNDSTHRANGESGKTQQSATDHYYCSIKGQDSSVITVSNEIYSEVKSISNNSSSEKIKFQGEEFAIIIIIFLFLIIKIAIISDILYTIKYFFGMMVAHLRLNFRKFNKFVESLHYMEITRYRKMFEDTDKYLLNYRQSYELMKMHKKKEKKISWLKKIIWIDFIINKMIIGPIVSSIRVHGPAILISIGILGTFIGLLSGISEINKHISSNQQSINKINFYSIFCDQSDNEVNDLKMRIFFHNLKTDSEYNIDEFEEFIIENSGNVENKIERNEEDWSVSKRRFYSDLIDYMVNNVPFQTFMDDITKSMLIAFSSSVLGIVLSIIFRFYLAVSNKYRKYLAIKIRERGIRFNVTLAGQMVMPL